MSTHPLSLIKMANVRVSGLTESSGTRFGRHSNIILSLSKIILSHVRDSSWLVHSYLLSIDKYSQLLVVNQLGIFHSQCGHLIFQI